MFRYKSILLVVVSVLLLAACQPVSIEDAQAQLCTDLEQFQAALDGVRALTAGSTVDEAEAAFDVANDAWNDVQNSARILNDAKYDNLDQAYEDLDDALRQIDEGDTVQDAAAVIQTQLVTVDAAYDEFYSLQCPE